MLALNVFLFTGSNILIWILMFTSFLLGWFLSKLYADKSKPKKPKPQKKTQEDGELNNKEETLTTEAPKIKAVLRYGRSGASVIDPDNQVFKSQLPKKNGAEKPKLNFGNIGVATTHEKDDLKQIAGIGPFIEKKLNDIGIFTYRQLSKMQEEDIETITTLIEFFPGRIKRDDWKGQAQNLMDE
ncbi:hypothetical protein SAMN04487906_2641 [Zhouia amylolytica]|uniref:Uncharacterized protein n=2 Tax=Zhouia amylolytica TaxID=376730 RepID=W2UNL4_9FLAO|nr:hypothetical protein [Zhouia amylolytica]ETN95544.1 hypothetical protein P278_12660 [Zhouia amylolytica AD3]SFT03597.1 hypothetical protein SAMN04487906_2641 [Zhouia amylolytica]